MRNVILILISVGLLLVAAPSSHSGEFYDLQETILKSECGKYTVFARKYYWHRSQTTDYVLKYWYLTPENPDWVMLTYTASFKGEERVFALAESASNQTYPTVWVLSDNEAKSTLYQVEFLCGWERKK
jgi:hypothetical protein